MTRARIEIYERDGEVLRLHLHPGQSRTWDSTARFVWMLAGTQGGKTSFGPWWLKREIDRNGGGDYLAATASFDLFKLKMQPELRRVFEHVLGIARYWSGDKVLELRNPATGEFEAERASDPMWGRIILRSAHALGGLEAATAKAAWLDEVGQPGFVLDAWEAIQRRVTLHQGRVLGTTTLYTLGWLKQQVYDRWRKGDSQHDVIQFASAANPAFPPEELEAARLRMPSWKFRMFFLGQYARPAGMIYDAFDEARHTTPRFAIPDEWERFVGLDFGGVNTAALFYAREPSTGKLYLYREYKAGGRTAKGHVRHILTGEPMVPFAVGGSKSEQNWRDEFSAAGLPVRAPRIGDVEVGIDRVYAAHAEDKIIVFDDLAGYLDEKVSYSRKLDANGEATEKIADKASYHYMDAERYIVGWLRH